MEINNIPEAFQTKLRLMIISALINGKKSFSEIKTITRGSDGNISVQISKLEEMGYLTVKKEFIGKKPLTTCELTQTGVESFKEYVEMLNGILTGGNEKNR